MKKLWKRERKYYLCIAIIIMIMGVFAAEKVHVIASKHVLSYYVFEEQYKTIYSERFAKQILEGEDTLEGSFYSWFAVAVETNYERLYWENRSKEDLYESPNQGREVFRGKLREAYRQSIKQAKFKGIDYLSDKEQVSVRAIFEKKVNQVYEEVAGRSIEQDYQTIMKNYSNKWEGNEYSKLTTLLNSNPSTYENMIEQLYDLAYCYDWDLFGYEENQSQFNLEFYAVMLFMIFIFIVQIFKWKYLENYEFERTLPIQKKTKTIYELLTGVGLISLPCLYFVIKGVVWQIYYSDLGYFGAMNQNLLEYTLSRVTYIFVSCLVLYLTFYLFRQMSYSVVFASVMYAVVGFPLTLYALRNAGWSIAVIGGLVASLFLVALNIWIGVRDEGSNTKLFKYKSFQVLVNLLVIGLLFALSIVLYSITEELLISVVVFGLLLSLIAFIDVWIIRYDYKQAS